MVVDSGETSSIDAIYLMMQKGSVNFFIVNTNKNNTTQPFLPFHFKKTLFFEIDPLSSFKLPIKKP